MNAWHMSGAGNDFIVLDARGKTLELSSLALAKCKKTGADGLLAVDVSDTADIRLHFYNPDGSRGEMCGNGARCVCKFAYDLGIAGEELTIETDAGLVRGWRLDDTHYRVQLNNPGIVDLARRPDAAYVELGRPGIPHSVTHVPGLSFDQKAQLLPVARELRHDPVFPKGVNVNLYHWLDDTTVRILTYERGVEDYTLACGTGSGSVAVVLWLRGELPGGVLKVENQGGMLTVSISGSHGTVEKVLLEGPVEVVKEMRSLL